tara:strand:- start:364 stop:687 length:324 start_codon:yes stop_codon:yes gene_type:complete
MYLTIDNASQFRDEFRAHNRGDQFSYEGLGLLFEYLEEADPQYDLDVIAICCEYSEENPEGIAKNYDFDLEGCETEADIAAAVLDYLHNETSVVGVTTSGEIIYQQF